MLSHLKHYKSHTLKDLKEFWRQQQIILTSLLSLALKAQHQTLSCYLTKLVGVWQPQGLGGNGLGPDFHSICTPVLSLETSPSVPGSVTHTSFPRDTGPASSAYEYLVVRPGMIQTC